jgi:hypothetical protein
MSLNKFVLETNRDITAAILQSYLPSEGSSNLLPSVIKKSDGDLVTKERLYKA